MKLIENYQNITSDPNDDTSSLGYNTFDVLESNKALVLSTDLIDNVDNPNENILTIKIAGIGDYEYALNSTSITNFTKGTDNLTFTFNEVKPGINTVYIRDLNGCGITSSQKLSFLFFQRHFTPNNDGVLDTWRILGANTNFYTSARVEIFDRYGKVVALITDKDDKAGMELIMEKNYLLMIIGSMLFWKILTETSEKKLAILVY